MNALRTLPKRTWLERVSLGLAGALCTIGVGSLLGWWLNTIELLQPFASHAPMKMNTALAFVLLGGSLIAIELGGTRLAFLAIGPVLIGVLTAVQDIFG